MRVIRELLAISPGAPDEERRARLLNILLLGVGALMLLALLFSGGSLILGQSEWDQVSSIFLGSLAGLAGVAAIFVVNRFWAGWLAAILFLLLLTAIFSVTDAPEQVASGRSTFLLVIPILIASVLLPPWTSFIWAVLSSLVLGAIALSVDYVPNVPSILGFFGVALVSWLSARSLERTLHELRTINIELDQRVDDRTRDLAEALAREHAEASKNQAILEGIADGVIVIDQGSRAIVANPAIGRILDRPADEIVGEDIRTILGDGLEREDLEMILGLLEQQDPHRASLKFDWHDKTLSVSFAPVSTTTRVAPGAVSGTVAVFRDFTREAEIDRMKSDFVSIVSHELRTPLTSIQGYLDLVLLGTSGPINKQQASFLQIAKGNAERLHSMVSDLLDISRIESGKVELDVQVARLPQIAKQVAASLQKEFDDRDLTLTLDVPEGLPEFFGDPGRIAQVLTNLLSNAYKYTEEGGATVRARKQGQMLRVDVIDTGLGISEEDREKLFGRFFRAQDQRVRQQTGTGLGLNITKSLVEMHGGDIWVESEPGHGSIFAFTLPLPAGLIELAGEAEDAPPDATVPEELAPRPEPPPIPSGPWVLVADDEPDIARLFQSQLQRAGYRVTIVTQGSRVVEVARQLRPELITLDLLMDVDGLQVLSDLKADPTTASIPVVVVSVVPEPKKGLARGAEDYLVKPLSEAELIAAVEQTLDKPEGQPGKILVVDDERDIVGWLKHSLTHVGFQVDEAYDGVQALEAVQHSLPDLILLDLKMPRLDGRGTIRRLREQPETREIPIIVLSANPVKDEEERAHMLSMGVRNFMHKPVTIEQLVAEVQKHLPARPRGAS